HRERVGRLDHPADMPWARRACGRKGAVRRTGAPSEHRGHARHQRFLDLLRADEMDVSVEAAGGEDFSFASDGFGSGTDDDRYIGIGKPNAIAGRGAEHVGIEAALDIESHRLGTPYFSLPMTCWRKP